MGFDSKCTSKAFWLGIPMKTVNHDVLQSDKSNMDPKEEQISQSTLNNSIQGVGLLCCKMAPKIIKLTFNSLNCFECFKYTQ